MFFVCQNLQLHADILAFFFYSGLLAWWVERMPLPKKKVHARFNVGAMMSKLKEARERNALEHQKVLTLSRDLQSKQAKVRRLQQKVNYSI